MVTSTSWCTSRIYFRTTLPSNIHKWLSHNLSPTANLFPDDTSVFSIVHDIDSSTKQLNDDLKKISDWAYQWKMSFSPDLSKQAREVIFSCKSSRVDYPNVTFNNSSVARTSCQKHLGLYLDEKLIFSHHIKEKISKTWKGIGIIRKLHYVLPRHSLLTICKSFIRPHLDYGDTIYDQPNNQLFFFNWDSPHARLNSHYEAWSYKKKSTKRP